jgi:hypothetical protein
MRETGKIVAEERANNVEAERHWLKRTEGDEIKLLLREIVLFSLSASGITCFQSETAPRAIQRTASGSRSLNLRYESVRGARSFGAS